MIRASWVISIAMIVTCAAGVGAQDGRLQQVRDDANASAPGSGTSSNGKSRDGNAKNCDDSRMNIDGQAFLLPFVLPMMLLDDQYEYRLVFARYPYVNDYRAYQIMVPDWAKAYYEFDTTDVPRKLWVMRLSIENGNDFDGMNRFNGQFKIEDASRWGIVTSWNYYRERLPCGCIDETVIGDTNLTFRFAQNEVASMYAGVGLRVLSDRQTSNFGFNFTYGGDWFPARPVIVSGVFDAGNLGSAGVIHVRGSVGAILYGCEVFAGYDFLRIGNTNLQGPMVGMRLWF